jgi:hypothetical protein
MRKQAGPCKSGCRRKINDKETQTNGGLRTANLWISACSPPVAAMLCTSRATMNAREVLRDEQRWGARERAGAL